MYRKGSLLGGISDSPRLQGNWVTWLAVDGLSFGVSSCQICNNIQPLQITLPTPKIINLQFVWFFSLKLARLPMGFISLARSKIHQLQLYLLTREYQHLSFFLRGKRMKIYIYIYTHTLQYIIRSSNQLLRPSNYLFL